jgi:DNA polymerase III delta prime subunit
MALNIHQSIIDKLKYFQGTHKTPNIIFHGQSGSGKRTIVNEFINMIYDNDKERIKSFVMYVNCAHGKGIKFIREELKFFAKTHINSNGGDIFKSIVLLNADKLTIDAQSALRRCIELFSHTTRFFIIVEDKYKLLKPILSRFCEIYVPEPIYNGNAINLYKFNLAETFKLKEVKTLRADWLKKELNKVASNTNLKHSDLLQLSTKFYEKGYSGLDLIQLLEKPNNIKISNITEEKQYELLFAFNKVRKEFRNEKILMMFILNFLFLSLEHNLENISFM